MINLVFIRFTSIDEKYIQQNYIIVNLVYILYTVFKWVVKSNVYDPINLL